MGKKSKRQRPGKATGASRREAIAARKFVVPDASPEKLDTLRAKADHHKLEFIAMKLDDTSQKIRSFHMQSYCSNLIAGASVNNEFISKEDRVFLKAQCKLATELPLHRVLAYYVRAMFYFGNMEFEDAIQCMEKAIQIGAPVSKQQDSTRPECRLLDGTTKQQQCQNVLTAFQSMKVVKNDPKTGENKLLKLHGGDHCDACGTAAQIGNGGTMLMDCCSACQLTYYCSKNCQQNHWKSHKAVCRRRGEFHVGDVAVVAVNNPESDPNAPSPVSSGEYVRILAVMEPRGLLVSWEDNNTTKTCAVDVTELKRCRPTTWDWVMNEKEANEFRKVVNPKVNELAQEMQRNIDKTLRQHSAMELPGIGGEPTGGSF